MNKIVKCKLCRWCVSLWTTHKKGKRRMTGWHKLKDHMYLYHFEEYEKLTKILDEEEREKQLQP